MIIHTFKRFIFIAIIALLPCYLSAEPTPAAGKTLFANNCASCHAKGMKKAATGPALAGVEERWAAYPREDLYAWIRNSQKLIKSGHPRAVELWNEYKPTVMNAAAHLTDEDIESILLYVDAQVNAVAAGGEGDEAGGGAAAPSKTPTWLYYSLFALLGILALILTRVISNLNVIAAKKEGREYESKTLIETLTSKGVLSFILFGAIIFGGYTTVNNAVSLGRQEGYAPEQPIKFSHATHAGVQKIDCQYCHDGARRSKHSVIPATNTCMNCHSAINVGSKYGTAELTKIYASVGYDPSTNKYIEGYEDMSNDEIMKVFSKWIGDNYKVENGIDEELELPEDGQKVVDEQWAHIVESLTNDQKTSVAGPIEWVRIHNLPDHVYFNHAQHVSVGKIECQQCHGTVEEMDIMAQHSPLSMGWCINCHRQTEVKFEGNEYYTSYENYHDALKDGTKDAVTVEDIGGLECQKCHY
jgi:mono/diheme cytochrome c family protein